MVGSKAWDWENIKSETWLKPSEESFYYAEKWRAEGRKRLLDLGCGMGRHAIFFDAKGFKVTAIDLSEYGVNNLRAWQKKNGTDFRTVKPGGRSWDCGVHRGSLYAGYPHLCLYADLRSAEAFYRKCLEYKEKAK